MNTPSYSKLKISNDVLSQEVGGETVLLDLQSENYFGLDEVGTRFWQLLQEGNDQSQIVGQLQDEYDVEEQQLKQDLDDLIKKLAEAGLISVEKT
ncbi:MAG: PqqD family protein [Proteobacteria bacterium]|nr:PqqD family protein [Pseudomonadota bacterium]